MSWSKRMLDVVVAGTALVLLSPVLTAVALAVRCALGRPVLFRQVRPGYQGRSFVLLKFRTMREAVDGAGRPLPDEQRLTRLGRLLRAASLDELPQLWNVLKGDMSLVGPRPLLMDYLPRYSPEQARRHQVHPGVTGWAQVNGRAALPWEERFRLDVWYVDHCSLWLDLKILALTVHRVLRARDVTPPGGKLGEVFLGSSPAGETGPVPARAVPADPRGGPAD